MPPPAKYQTILRMAQPSIPFDIFTEEAAATFCFCFVMDVSLILQQKPRTAIRQRHISLRVDYWHSN